MDKMNIEISFIICYIIYGDDMKIFEKDLCINKILNVVKATSGIQSYKTINRESDALVYILSGSVNYSDSNKNFIGNKGNVIFLSRGSSYRISIKVKDYSFIVVNFLFDESNNTVIENEVFTFNNSLELDNKFIKLNKIWPVCTIESKIKSKSILYDIYSELSKCSTNEYLPTESKIIIYTITKEIIRNVFDPRISISKIIESYNISEAHFRRLFKKIYKLSPVKFVQNIRINKAKQLLIDKNLPINLIAKKCGYEDEFYFSRIFKKATGITASEYRKYSQKYYK